MPALIPTNDGRWLDFTAPVAGAYELWRIALDDGRVERLTEGRHYVSAWHAVPARCRRRWHPDRLPALERRPSHPTCGCSTSGGPPGPTPPRDGSRRSTPTSWPTSSCASRSSATSTVDGRDIQGWFLPGGDGPRPLVLEIHGGPHTLYGWSPVWEFQILAAAGIGVFHCNPRGSEGYGEAFNDANHRDWGPGPMRDVLAGVDALVADGLADPDRLGVTGGSYGGYLTNWIVGHDDGSARR